MGVVDTGTSVFAGPSKKMDPIIQQIGNVTEDCSNIGKLPTISFTLGGKDFDLGPDFYVIRAKDDSGKEQCQLGIQSINAGVPIWILGDPFLRKYYTIWDAEQQRIGFASASESIGFSVEEPGQQAKLRAESMFAKAGLSKVSSASSNG